MPVALVPGRHAVLQGPKRGADRFCARLSGKFSYCLLSKSIGSVGCTQRQRNLVLPVPGTALRNECRPRLAANRPEVNLYDYKIQFLGNPTIKKQKSYAYKKSEVLCAERLKFSVNPMPIPLLLHSRKPKSHANPMHSKKSQFKVNKRLTI